MTSFPWVRRRRLKAAIKEAENARVERDAASEERDRARSDLTKAQAELRHALTAVSQWPYTSNGDDLRPIAVCRSKSDWEEFRRGPEFDNARKEDDKILAQNKSESEWGFVGYSRLARALTIFKVETPAGVAAASPNLRESLVCPITSLNNRQRLIGALLENELSRRRSQRPAVYLTEQVTPFFQWARSAFPDCDVLGSEYLGADLKPGQDIGGLRHENLEDLSFADATLDAVVSNDVLEHVNSPAKSFRELARVLRPGSQALMTFPFFPAYDRSVTRAEIIAGEIKHCLEPVYHGNPVSAEGSLVFTDFGWDVLELAKDCGFAGATLELYHSVVLGHLGLGFVFRLIR